MSNSDPQREYKPFFYFKIPNHLQPQSVGVKLIVLNESYVNIISQRNTPAVVSLINNQIFESNLPLDKYRFKVMHKRNCSSNRTSYYITFKLLPN